ncbi:hypothetical protein RUM43_012289 [Polyplax serrata]|uniref:Uncharacterized protein n=1 Tax=Polyplax serrata TaxID=468196 RepID=A0AAN8PDA6_POLSC
MPTKVTFSFRRTEAGTQVNTICDVKEGKTYAFPKDLESIDHHSELLRLDTIRDGLKNLKVGQIRNLRITLKQEEVAVYFDKHGNPVFYGEYLDELIEIPRHEDSISNLGEVFRNKILIQNKTPENIVLEHFNAEQ